jgi:Holliday junction resolvase RusA-like endonuclease
VRKISFVVYGHAAPQGSSRAFVPKGWKRPIVTSTNPELKPWRQQVSGVAVNLGETAFDQHVPVRISLDFYFSRPKSVSVKKRPGMTSAPDGDKLARGCADALKGILLHDDAQIVNWKIRKFYGDPERVEVTISEDCE